MKIDKGALRCEHSQDSLNHHTTKSERFNLMNIIINIEHPALNTSTPKKMSSIRSTAPFETARPVWTMSQEFVDSFAEMRKCE